MSYLKTSTCFLENFEESFAEHQEVFVFRVSLARNQTDVFCDHRARKLPFARESQEQVIRRLVFAAGCYQNQPTKQKNVFEQVKAAKRKVATRPPTRFVGQPANIDERL